MRFVMLVAVVALLAFGQSANASQETTNRNASAKSHIKQSGKESAEAGKSLGHNVKHGRIARGGKQFGKHAGRAAKHFGKSTKAVAKKTGNVAKKAVKP
jgi:hypothetical protein